MAAATRAIRSSTARSSPSGRVLVGEVDRRLDMGQRSGQLGAPAVMERGQRAAGLAPGLAPLRLGLGVDQIGDRLDLGQVELAGEEGAAG